MKLRETEKISDLKVLKSAAGYYIGREYFDEGIGTWLPYSRESDTYWAGKNLAFLALATGVYPKREI